jgi:ABC-2 type transport system ATP-binding protein
MSKEAMISVRNVSKHYGNFLALDHVEFDVGKGDIVAFLGPNGAGKTTTMRIITGFMPPTEGDVLIGGLDVFEEPMQVKTMIGYLPENPPLYPELTVTEYLTFVAELRKVNKFKIKQQVEDAIDATDLIERRNTLIGVLSKGLKQRTGIAQAIVNNPSVLVLDEPTVGLDPLQVVDIRNLIKKLAREDRTIILSTHILAEAEEICEKAVIIQNGKILAVDTIENLKKAKTNEAKITLRVLRNPESLIASLKKLPSVRDAVVEENQIIVRADSDIREVVARTAVESNSGLVELNITRSSLEDIFIQLMQ